MTTADQAIPIGRLLRVSGWLELLLGTGHTIFGTLILTRPGSVASLVGWLGWPAAILSPIGPPEQHALVLAMSLGAGIDWLLFGGILLWQGWTRPMRPDVPLLGFVLLHQLGLATLIVLCVRWHVVAVATVLVMVLALGGALTLARRTGSAGAFATRGAFRAATKHRGS